MFINWGNSTAQEKAAMEWRRKMLEEEALREAMVNSFKQQSQQAAAAAVMGGTVIQTGSQGAIIDWVNSETGLIELGFFNYGTGTASAVMTEYTGSSWSISWKTATHESGWLIIFQENSGNRIIKFYSVDGQELHEPVNISAESTFDSGSWTYRNIYFTNGSSYWVFDGQNLYEDTTVFSNPVDAWQIAEDTKFGHIVQTKINNGPQTTIKIYLINAASASTRVIYETTFDNTVYYGNLNAYGYGSADFITFNKSLVENGRMDSLVLIDISSGTVSYTFELGGEYASTNWDYFGTNDFYIVYVSETDFQVKVFRGDTKTLIESPVIDSPGISTRIDTAYYWGDPAYSFENEPIHKSLGIIVQYGQNVGSLGWGYSSESAKLLTLFEGSSQFNLTEISEPVTISYGQIINSTTLNVLAHIESESTNILSYSIKNSGVSLIATQVLPDEIGGINTIPTGTEFTWSLSSNAGSYNLIRVNSLGSSISEIETVVNTGGWNDSIAGSVYVFSISNDQKIYYHTGGATEWQSDDLITEELFSMTGYSTPDMLSPSWAAALIAPTEGEPQDYFIKIYKSGETPTVSIPVIPERFRISKIGVFVAYLDPSRSNLVTLKLIDSDGAVLQTIETPHEAVSNARVVKDRVYCQLTSQVTVGEGLATYSYLYLIKPTGYTVIEAKNDFVSREFNDAYWLND